MAMGYVFSKTGTDKQKLTLERKNVQRILCVTLFLAVLALFCVFFLNKAAETVPTNTLSVGLAFYAVMSVAFACFAFQLLKRKSKKSELWLFQMVYMILNTSFLTYIAFSVWEVSGSLLAYCLVVVMSSCSLLYSKGEYLICLGIELSMPLILILEKVLLPHQMVLIGAVHLLGGGIAYEVCKGYRMAEEYRRKYVQEVKAAEMDPLTKVNNRRGMMRRVVSVWPALEQANRSVAVMVIDIDHFKKYNDRFGHPGGDACLCKVAETVRRTVKGMPALVSRIGGEEFLVFLHGKSDEEVYSLAEQIRENVEGLGMLHAEDAKYRYVTVSIGVATDICSAEISFGGLYRRADKEVYRSKNLGRNRVSYRGGDFSTGMDRRVGLR